MKKVLFITGTRADYGKIKPLIRGVEESDDFIAYVFVSGMHLIESLGDTYAEVLKDNYENTHVAYGLTVAHSMSSNLGDTIKYLSGYVEKINPDLIVVHGDRIDALAGAIVGALNNIRVAHIEGGELSGTIDNSIRHAISKFAHIHFVSNAEARQRLLQLGEEDYRIFVIGSPDIDIMMSTNLPDIEKVKQRYDIGFDEYGILIYHPVTTEYAKIARNAATVTAAAIKSGRNYIVISPNNDIGYEFVINAYTAFDGNARFRCFPSLRFEYFLTLLKHADFILGNSSAGIREAGVFGIPAIDVGTRQSDRYQEEALKNVRHVDEDVDAIIGAIDAADEYRVASLFYGSGNSKERFMQLLQESVIWESDMQKQFVDLYM